MPKTFSNGYALIIGVGADLRGTIDDAEGIASILTNVERCGYPDEQVLLLTGRNASRKDILRGLMWISKSADKDSTVIIYFSGHGYRVVSQGKQTHYLAPNDYDFTRYAETCIRGADFAGLLKMIPARKLVVLLDCCHAAGIAGANSSGVQFVKTPLHAEPLSLIEKGDGKVIIGSSRAHEFSHAGEPYSIFTQTLIEALSGQGATDLDGYVRVADLALYTHKEVTRRTADRQHPTLHFKNADNFVLAYYAGGNLLTKPVSSTPTPPPQSTTERKKKQPGMKIKINEIHGPTTFIDTPSGPVHIDQSTHTHVEKQTPDSRASRTLFKKLAPLIKRLPLEPDVRARTQQWLNDAESQQDEEQALQSLKRAVVGVAETFIPELEKQNLSLEALRVLKDAWESVLIQIGKKAHSKAMITVLIEHVTSTVQGPEYPPRVREVLLPLVDVITCWA